MEDVGIENLLQGKEWVAPRIRTLLGIKRGGVLTPP
jgi:hypothetical protein